MGCIPPTANPQQRPVLVTGTCDTCPLPSAVLGRRPDQQAHTVQSEKFVKQKLPQPHSCPTRLPCVAPRHLTPAPGQDPR